MRSGIIPIKELEDPHVLCLAEFLGIESLLGEVKARSFYNMNPRYNGTSDEASTEFDQIFDSSRGSIQTAIYTWDTTKIFV